ncbi:MAG: LD-carboxypeptidase [Candidatus Aminicenantes bacterium]|nr:LD-carboxypeptidase [Candidatus Aminicenantes bacterium]
MNKKPGKLKKGDKVGIFVPSSPVKESYRRKGLEAIRQLGYEPVEVDDILAKRDFVAKEPEASFADLQGFFDNPEIKAVWAARGGYGAKRLLPFLSGLEIAEAPMVIGSSDVSYLLWYLLDRFKLVVFYGPMAYSALADDRANIDNLVRILSGDYDGIEVPGSVLKPGKVKGIVTGGCLSNFVSLIGTPYLPQVEERVLLLEDVGERPYRLDRMIWQIAQAGLFSRIKALLLGQFPGCFKDPEEKENFLQRMTGYFAGHDIPIIYDLPFGHGENIHTLPLGIQVEIDAPWHGVPIRGSLSKQDSQVVSTIAGSVIIAGHL